jgi:hypothetical protein
MGHLVKSGLKRNCCDGANGDLPASREPLNIAVHFVESSARDLESFQRCIEI